MRIRVLITKLGLDEHYFGAQLIAHALRNAGMEVIVMFKDMTPEEVVKAAVEEDVDVVGISIMMGNYLYLLPECVRQLREAGKGDALIICGGMIDETDYPFLREAGIAGIWGPGASTAEIVNFIKEHFSKRQEKS